MARPVKIGLEYFPLDVSIDDNLELIEAEHGLQGFAIVIKLWQKIYANGYFIEWSGDHAMLFAKKINTELTLVNDVINSCFRRNIFDKTLHDDQKVLSSRGIQKRYQLACQQSRRKNYEIEDQYNLLKTQKKEFTPNKPGLTPHLPELTPAISTQSKVKESKVDNIPPLSPLGETSSKIDYGKIVEFYNQTCARMPQANSISETRKKSIRARVKEYSEEKVMEMFKMAGESEFLNGNNGHNWVANIDWLLKPTNFVKVIEGNFKNLRNNGKYKANDPRSSLATGYQERL